MMEWFSDLILLSIANDQSWKLEDLRKLRINTLIKYVECVCSSEF